MLDIGFQELAVIMVLALLIFGPDKLPELGKRLGRAMREFRRASDEFRSTVEQNLQINADVSPSAYNPPSTEPPSTDASEATGAASQVSEPATREPAP
jgi:TatA/E family protein of Tat protein translocase